MNQQMRRKMSRWIHWLLSIVVVVTMIRQFFLGNWEGILMCLLTLVLFMIPQLIEKTAQIKLPLTLEVVVLLFIFAAEILGEIHNFYGTFRYWDSMLHVINGFLATAIGFSLIDILNQEDRFYIKMAPVFVTVVAFSFSMTIGVLWEFFEFGVDMLFQMDMQKDVIINRISSVKLNTNLDNVPVVIDGIQSAEIVAANGSQRINQGYLDIGLLDTMKDLIVNFIGTVIFSVFGWLYLRNRHRYRFVARFIPRRKS